MKKRFLLPMSLMVLFVICVMSSKAMATEHSVTASGDVFANVVGGITITPDSTVKLNFGDIISDAETTLIEVSPSGVLTVTGEASVSGAYSQGEFKVSGEPGKTYYVGLDLLKQVPNTTDTGAQPMTLAIFKSDPPVEKGGVIGADGTQTLSVGAILTVWPNQAVGVYEGTYDVTVNYE